MHSSHISLQKLQAIQAIQYTFVLATRRLQGLQAKYKATQYSSILCMQLSSKVTSQATQ